MAKYLIRLYDNNIRTNYIERVVYADDNLDALNKAKSDSDIQREAKTKLSSTQSIPDIIDLGTYELIEL